MEETTQRMPGTGVLIAGGLVIVAAIAAIALIGGPRVVEYAAGTPEAAAQEYVQALLDEDYDLAFTYLAPEIQADCDVGAPSNGLASDSAVIVFDNVRTFDERTTIDARISWNHYEPGPFPVDEHETTTRLTLELRNDEWRIVAARWPLDGCTRR